MKTQLRGLLNTILKDIRTVTGESITKEAGKLIMVGIRMTISDEEIAKDFILYCKDSYDIIIK